MRRGDVRFCEGLRMPAHDDSATHTGGRRPQTSKGGNRGRYGEVARQTLWGFRRWRFVAEVRWRRFADAIEKVGGLDRDDRDGQNRD
jgi:hypothetical protein